MDTETAIAPAPTVAGPFPAIYTLDNEQYHAGPGISKSGLWTIYDQTPGHWFHGQRKETPAFAYGTLVHCAVLEPEELERRYARGPDCSRATKEWKAFELDARADGKDPVKGEDFDEALMLRDRVAGHSLLGPLLQGCEIEKAGYWNDPVTGQLCRCKPDAWHPGKRVMVDLKTTRSAALRRFQVDVARFGYHAQEAFYTDGWTACGNQVDAFVFAVIESSAPNAIALYELSPNDVAEGRAAMRKALDIYDTCMKSDHWPMYPVGVQQLSIPRWAYIETTAQDDIDDQDGQPADM